MKAIVKDVEVGAKVSDENYVASFVSGMSHSIGKQIDVECQTNLKNWFFVPDQKPTLWYHRSWLLFPDDTPQSSGLSLREAVESGKMWKRPIDTEWRHVDENLNGMIMAGEVPAIFMKADILADDYETRED